MKEYNSLLKRQIKKANLDLTETSDQGLVALLDFVNEAYFGFEEDKVLLERSINISSREYQETIEATKMLQSQLVQNEKMAGIGQLSAGIAHEINNPLGYVQSNLETLNKYMSKMKEMCHLNGAILENIDQLDLENLKKELGGIKEYIAANKLHYICDDLSDIMEETSDGLKRINKIVTSLLGFSRQYFERTIVDYDLNKGIRDTLVIATNQIKYVASVEEQLEKIPLIQAYAGEVNQVLLNLIVNAAHAIKSKGIYGTITVKTYHEQEYVFCKISDNGMGISEEIITKIFDPFFTTKPVGSGTGLGLSISYDIIVNMHHGEIAVESVLSEGTSFILKLPVIQSKKDSKENLNLDEEE